MQFLKKTITVKINLFALVIAVLLLAAIILGIYLHVPENLFFMTLSPSQISSVQICTGFDTLHEPYYDSLNEQEIAALIQELRNFRVGNHVEPRTSSPSSQASSSYHIYTIWGTTLHLDLDSIDITVNGNTYSDQPELEERLYTLYRQQCDARK